MTPHDLAAAVVVTVLAGVAAVAAWVVAMVSDPVLVSAVSATGALLVSIVGVIGTLLARRDGKAARDVAESIHHQVAVNGHSSDEPTLRDRVADLQASQDQLNVALTDTNHALADHIVIGRQALGEVRKQVARVARDIERMQEDS